MCASRDVFFELLRQHRYQFDFWKHAYPPCGRSNHPFCELDATGRCLTPGCLVSSVVLSS